jgi:hypothetical protein
MNNFTAKLLASFTSLCEDICGKSFFCLLCMHYEKSSTMGTPFYDTKPRNSIVLMHHFTSLSRRCLRRWLSTMGVKRPIGYLMGVSGLALIVLGWLVGTKGFTSANNVPEANQITRVGGEVAGRKGMAEPMSAHLSWDALKRYVSSNKMKGEGGEGG